MSHPLGDALVRAEIETRALLLMSRSAGKVTVELNFKDGSWTLGNISVTFPKVHGVDRGAEKS